MFLKIRALSAQQHPSLPRKVWWTHWHLLAASEVLLCGVPGSGSPQAVSHRQADLDDTSLWAGYKGLLPLTKKTPKKPWGYSMVSGDRSKTPVLDSYKFSLLLAIWEQGRPHPTGRDLATSPARCRANQDWHHQQACPTSFKEHDEDSHQEDQPHEFDIGFEVNTTNLSNQTWACHILQADATNEVAQPAQLLEDHTRSYITTLTLPSSSMTSSSSHTKTLTNQLRSRHGLLAMRRAGTYCQEMKWFREEVSFPNSSRFQLTNMDLERW